MSSWTSSPASSEDELVNRIRALRAKTGSSAQSDEQFDQCINAILQAPRSQLARMARAFPNKTEVNVQLEALIDSQVQRVLALSSSAVRELEAMRGGLLEELGVLTEMAESPVISDIDLGPVSKKIAETLSEFAKTTADLERKLKQIDENRVL